MSTNKQNIEVLIVSYNSSKYLSRCINSLSKISHIIGKITIIDNNSNDIDKVKIKNNKVELIRNQVNIGFSKAVNQGIRASTYDYILLLNPDTEVADASITEMFKLIKNDDKIGAIGGTITDFYNSSQKTATNFPTFLSGIFEFSNIKKIFRNNLISRNFWAETEEEGIHFVTSLCGAFILIRRELKNELNLFDESFFLYLEDIDFGIKLNKLGYKVIYYPKATVRHIGGASSGSKYRTVLKYWYDSRRKLFQKYLPPYQSWTLNRIYDVEEYLLKRYHQLKDEPTE